MKIGSTPITDIKVGSTPITKVIRNGITYWEDWTPQSLVVEDAQPTHIVMTGTVANTNAVASDFTIAGFTVNSISRDGTNKILTLTLSTSVVYGDVLTVVYKGVSYLVTNNVAISAEYLTVKAAMTTPPSLADQKIQNRWVYDLITLGVWDKAILLDNAAMPDKQSSYINWKNPGTFNPSNDFSGPTFFPYKGWQGRPGVGAVNLNFIPAVNGSGFLGAEDITIILCVNEELADNTCDFGGDKDGSTNISIYSRMVEPLFYATLNGSHNYKSQVSFSSKRYFVISKNDPFTMEIWKNYMKVTQEQITVGLCNGNLYACGTLYVQNQKTESFVLIFKYLTDSEVISVIEACDRYLKSYGNNLLPENISNINLNILLEGHSFMPTAAVVENVGYKMNIHNISVGGSTIWDCIARAATADSFLVTETSTLKNIEVLWVGVNEVNETAGTGLTSYNALKSYVQARVTAGWKVFVFTMTPATVYDNRGAQFEIERGVFNGLLRSDLSTINGVYIMDTDTIAVMDAPDDVTNVTYWTNTLHLSITGLVLAGELLKPKLDELYG